MSDLITIHQPIQPAETIGIYIPTKGRARKERQYTLNEFKNKSTYVPTLVCPLNEHESLSKLHQDVMWTTAQDHGIGAVKSEIFEQVQLDMGYSNTNKPDDIILFIDDDLKFQKRKLSLYGTLDMVDTKLKPCNDLDAIIEEVFKVVNRGYLHGGMSDRNGSNFFRDRYSYCVKTWAFTFFHKSIIHLLTDVYKCKLMEDIWMTLRLITQGYPNILIREYVHRQAYHMNADGGCSTYRTTETQLEAANYLAACFPKYVTVREKKVKWHNGVTKIADVRVRWKQAAKDADITLPASIVY